MENIILSGPHVSACTRAIVYQSYVIYIPPEPAARGTVLSAEYHLHPVAIAVNHYEL